MGSFVGLSPPPVGSGAISSVRIESTALWCGERMHFGGPPLIARHSLQLLLLLAAAPPPTLGSFPGKISRVTHTHSGLELLFSLP